MVFAREEEDRWAENPCLGVDWVCGGRGGVREASGGGCGGGGRGLLLALLCGGLLLLALNHLVVAVEQKGSEELWIAAHFPLGVC